MSRQIATFILGETLLGIDILLVKEVYRQISITPIPDAPPHLRGLINLRGRVVTVIDLNACLGRSEISDIKKNRLLIMKTDDEVIHYQREGQIDEVNLGEDIVGFLIDSMDNVLSIEDSEILPAPSNLKSVEVSLIEGVIKLGDRLVILLDVNALLERVLSVVKKTTDE